MKECLISMDLDLTPFIKTRGQATDFISRIASISAKVYETDFNLEQTLLDEFGIGKKDKFMTLLRNNKVNPESATALKDFLTKLMETAKTIPVLSMTISFEPKEKILTALSEWCVMNLKKQMIFDITVDSKIIAGASIDYKGKHVDATIRPIFNKLLKETLNPPQPKQEENKQQVNAEQTA